MCLVAGCFGGLWAWDSGWKILKTKIFIILVTATCEASLIELASYVGVDTCLKNLNLYT